MAGPISAARLNLANYVKNCWIVTIKIYPQQSLDQENQKTINVYHQKHQIIRGLYVHGFLLNK